MTFTLSVRRIIIYIPLCFYFIWLPDEEKIHGFAFTFHYASTLSACLRSDPDWEYPFTFHYASTLSAMLRCPAMLGCNLHSTMLLLYLMQTWKTEGLTIFTFHYASTLSISMTIITDMLVNLHSTMLLLYRDREHPETVPRLIYIPLCFYFICI